MGGIAVHPLAEASAAPARALVLIAGDDVYEDLFLAAAQLQELLSAAGFAARTGYGLGRLATAGRHELVVLYTAAGEVTDAQTEALERAVRAGTGLLAMHSTTVPGGGGPRARLLELVGSSYLSHGPRPHTSRFRVRVEAGHPVTAAVDDFEIEHEHYLTRTAPDRRVLAWRATPDGDEPLVHIGRRGEGRVCYIQLGHDIRAWGEPPVRRLVANAARWAARGARR